MKFEFELLSNMKGFFSLLILLGIFVAANKNGIGANPTNDAEAAKSAMETAMKAIALSNEIMDLFTEEIDQEVPWKKLENSLNELNKFRDDYSKRAAQLVAEMKTHMFSGINAYNQASKNVCTWCKVIQPLLQKYIDLFDNIDKIKSAEQKKILIEMLDDGIKEMEKAQKMLGDSSSSFNGAAGRLTVLRHQLSTDFNRNSEFFNKKIKQKRAEGYGISAIFGPLSIGIAAIIIETKIIPDIKSEFRKVEKFYVNLNGIVDKSSANIDETKIKLNNEIRAIGELKVQTEAMNLFASMDGLTALRDIVISSAKDLIGKCTSYRNKHKL